MRQLQPTKHDITVYSNAVVPVEPVTHDKAISLRDKQGKEIMRTSIDGKPKTVKQAPYIRIAPVQFSRIRYDVINWRNAIIEAENVWRPFRVAMQRIYQDTVLNEQVEACMTARKDLTMLRKFALVDEAGEEDEDATKALHKTWFNEFISHVLDAIFFGYNVIFLGTIVGDDLPNLTFIKRQNVSPDRLTIGNFEYSFDGAEIMGPDLIDWCIYVKTVSDTGASPCGYGLLYKVAKTEIFLRNNSGQNADYNEMYGQPLRKGRTSKQGEERDQFEADLRNMGSNAYMIFDDTTDDLEIIHSPAAGTAYMTYADFEQRGEKKISKVILGHADALDSVPGKLGAGSGEDNLVTKALHRIQSKDAKFVEPIVNDQLLPRLIKMGFKIFENRKFVYSNDEEKEAFRKREDESNLATATVFKTITDAGGDPDWAYFSKRTGIDVKKKEEPVTPPPGEIVPGKKAPTVPGAATKK